MNSGAHIMHFFWVYNQNLSVISALVDNARNSSKKFEIIYIFPHQGLVLLVILILDIPMGV